MLVKRKVTGFTDSTIVTLKNMGNKDILKMWEDIRKKIFTMNEKLLSLEPILEKITIPSYPGPLPFSMLPKAYRKKTSACKKEKGSEYKNEITTSTFDILKTK